MSELYSIVDPEPAILTSEQKKRNASCLFNGNFGAVYPKGNGTFEYEFQTGAHGGRVFTRAISEADLAQLKNGELTEEELVGRFRSEGPLD